MDLTVREHILELYSLSTSLTANLLHAGSAQEQKTLEKEIRAVDAALAHFRTALEIESILQESFGQKGIRAAA